MTGFKPKEKEPFAIFELSCLKKMKLSVFFLLLLFFNKCVHVIRPFDIRIYFKNLIIAAKANDSILRFGLIHHCWVITKNKRK